MIKFESKNEYFKNPFGAVAVDENVNFTIEVISDNFICEAYLVMALDNCPPVYISYTERIENIFKFEWKVPFKGLFFYCFKVVNEVGMQEMSETNKLTAYERTGEVVPKWLSYGLMYQIFPDRFARDKAFDFEETENYMTRGRWLHKRWGEMPERNNVDFFGGNIDGIIERLDYLVDMGVTVIYLNPIFEAFSNHRYDTGDYLKIDRLLGSEEDFTKLCEEAKKRGMKIIIDGVFNHTGSDSVYFNKYNSYSSVGAYNSQNSEYYKWYKFIDYPEKYESWWGIDTLPNINENNQDYQKFIYGDDNSVVEKWLNCGVDGIRLDVVDELPDEFLDGLVDKVKTLNKNAAIIGEVWEDASDKIAYGVRRRYFQGGQLDSVMNYPLKLAIIEFVKSNMSGYGFSKCIRTLEENYPKDNFYSLMNIVGTHDTERIRSVLEDDGKLMKAITLQMFLPGIPCIYYGDENGMTGGRDPENRQCFQEDKRDSKIYDFYKYILEIRQEIAGIGKVSKDRYTAFKEILVKDKLYVFSRENSEMILYVGINNGDEDEIGFSIWWNTGENGEVISEYKNTDDCGVRNTENSLFRYVCINEQGIYGKNKKLCKLEDVILPKNSIFILWQNKKSD